MVYLFVMTQVRAENRFTRPGTAADVRPTHAAGAARRMRMAG